jgi:hypothetical protein
MCMALWYCWLRGPIVLFILWKKRLRIKRGINEMLPSSPKGLQKLQLLLVRHLIFFHIRQVFF